MPKPTRVYGRWEKGLVWDGDDRSWEMYLDLGGVRTAEAARGICSSVRNGLTGAPEVGTTYTKDARQGGSYPWLGDSFGGGIVTGLSASLSDNGATVTAQTVTYETFRMEAEARKLQRAAKGVQSLWGTPQYARYGQGVRQDTTPPEFSFDGVLKPRYSVMWQAPKNWWFCWFDVKVVTPGDKPSTFKIGKLFQDGPGAGAVVPMASCVLPANKRRHLVKLPNTETGAGVQAGEMLIAWCSVAGGCEQATVSLHGAMV